jgi:hypothetical protein
MRSTDRDYYMSTLAVLQSQRRMIQSISDDMYIRIEEMEDMIAMQFDQKEDETFDLMIDDAWQSGYDYCMWSEDKVIPNKKYCTCEGAEPKKECMCDDCWSDNTGSPDYRMD